MEFINLTHSGYDIDYAIMAFCGDTRVLGDFKVAVADFCGGSGYVIHTESRSFNGVEQALETGKVNVAARRIESY